MCRLVTTTPAPTILCGRGPVDCSVQLHLIRHAPQHGHIDIAPGTNLLQFLHEPALDVVVGAVTGDPDNAISGGGADRGQCSPEGEHLEHWGLA